MAHKIILINNPTIKYIDNEKTNGIGGFGEKTELTLYLNDAEYNAFREIYKRMVADKDMVLYHFTHQEHCTSHHKQKIWKHIRVVMNLQIKGL